MTEARVDIKSPRQIAVSSPRHRKSWKKTEKNQEEKEGKGESSEFPEGEPSHPLPVSAFSSPAGDVHVANAANAEDGADAVDAPFFNSECSKERRPKKSAIFTGSDGVEWHARSVLLGLGLGFTLALVVTSRNSLSSFFRKLSLTHAF
jgi:hypothetical protein